MKLPENKLDDRSAVYGAALGDIETDPRMIAAEWIRNSQRVLDVGCACGELGVFLNNNRKCEVYGFEYNRGSIEIAKKTNAYKEIHQVDLNHFSPEDFGRSEYFDVIIICDVLEHLLNPLETLRKLILLLKPNGSIIMSIPNITHASIKILLLSNKIRYTEIGLLDETHLRFFTWRSIYNLLSDAQLVADKASVVPCNMDGGFPGGVHGYITDRTILKKILGEDESYVFQYVISAQRNNSSPSSFKQFKKLIMNSIDAQTEAITHLRIKDFKKLALLNPLTLRLRHLNLEWRRMIQAACNQIVPSKKRQIKIDRLNKKIAIIKQALA